MATITKPNTLSDGSTILAAEHNENYDTIYNDYNGNITNDNISGSAAIVDTKLAQITTVSKVHGSSLTGLASITSASGIIPVANIETIPWADYSTASTIAGWSSYTIKKIYTKKIGKTVFVAFDLEGVSNATTVTFTLPYTSSDAVSPLSCVYTYDNGTATTTGGRLSIVAGTSTAGVYKDMASGAWTNSGDKYTVGQFFYECA